tara:strand:- start:2276 stop:2551 length:276 start_codon:yes stop_codon:yes gene_type:complete
MPRYRYRCAACDIEDIIVHLFDEVIRDCNTCGEKDTMQKLLSKPLYVDTKKKSANSEEVGKITREYIEENRELLNTMKKEAMEDLKLNDKT